MTERRKNQSEEWTYFTLLFMYFIAVNKYRFCISVIGYINVQIIGIGSKKINIGRSLVTMTIFFWSITGISVCISTFSLVAIAIERYSAICNPLKSRAWQTRSHAYKVIASTWVLSFLIMTPYPIFSALVKFIKPNNITAHMCRHDWPKSEVEQAWWVFKYSCVLIWLYFMGQ